DNSANVQFAGRNLTIPLNFPLESTDIAMVVRPEKISLDAPGGWQGTVADTLFKGASMSYTVQLEDGTELTADVAHDDKSGRHTIGDPVAVNFRESDVTLVPGSIGAE